MRKTFKKRVKNNKNREKCLQKSVNYGNIITVDIHA